MTASDDIRARILAEAEKPLPDLIGPLAEARAHLLAQLDGVTEEGARFKLALSTAEGPPSGEGEDAWCIAEVLRHLVQAEEGLAERIEKLARGEPAEGSAPGRLGGHEDASLPALVAALGSVHERVLAVVAAVSGHERLDTTAPHAFFGDLNARGWLAFFTVHVRSHVRQVADIKALPGFPG